MPRKPRAVQPWSSPRAAEKALEAEFGSADQVGGLLFSMNSTKSFFEGNVGTNRLRKYKDQIASTMASLTTLIGLAQEFGFPDRPSLELALREITEVESRHAVRTDPPQLPSSQLPPHIGHGSTDGDPESLRGMSATLGALLWFERNSSEVSVEPSGRLLHLCAVALGLEPTSQESNSLKGGPIDSVQKKWSGRIADVHRQAAAPQNRSRLTKITRANWDHLPEKERRNVRAAILELEQAGRPIEAFALRIGVADG